MAKSRLTFTLQYDFEVNLKHFPPGFTVDDATNVTAQMIEDNLDVFVELVEDGSMDIVSVKAEVIEE